MELKLSINPRKAESMGIKVYASADGQEETVLTYYPSKNEFTLDFANSSLNNEYMEGYLWEKDKIQKARLSLVGKENLDLRIFIDRSVIEVFVNENNDFLIGDLNFDNTLDVIDIVLLVSYIIGESELNSRVTHLFS